MPARWERIHPGLNFHRNILKLVVQLKLCLSVLILVISLPGLYPGVEKIENPAQETFTASYAAETHPVTDLIYITENGHAEFTSSVPLHTFTGVSDYLTGMIDFEENLIDFYLDLESLKTGISRRDRDMYRTLQVDEHPFAEFTGFFSGSVDPDAGGIQSVTVEGEFTIHGVTREISLDGTLEREGDSIRITAEWILDITDYNIEPPGILIYRVRDEMDVRIDALLEPRERGEM